MADGVYSRRFQTIAQIAEISAQTARPNFTGRSKENESTPL